MSVNAADITSRLAIDAHGVDKLRAQAQQDPQAALKTAAHQFEAIFMSMLLKSMRDATPQDGPFDSEQTRLYTSLLDQQLAQTLANARGIGLADLMVKQLTNGRAAPSIDASSAQAPGAISTQTTATAASPPSQGVRRSRDFLAAHAAEAQAASAATGIPAPFLLAQAALESGWGRREIRGTDGTPSYNLFGIKAGRRWTGPVVEAQTTEYSGGTAYTRTERFRAYPSYAESFADYANLIRTSPRYAGVRNQADARSFAYGLQRAGYATDPRYAEKLLTVLDGMRASARSVA